MVPPQKSSPPKILQPLNQVRLERTWPSLSTPALALAELEQDETHPLLSARLKFHLLQRALQLGEHAADNRNYGGDLARLMNRMIQSGVRVRFIDNQHGQNHWVRAQYLAKPKIIEINRASLDQLRHFFERSGDGVQEDDIIALHLYHEWFHHLETTRLGRADLRLPRAVKKRWGPITFRQPVRRTREIAAHAFTQKAMNLNWSPLLLDYLLLLTEKGWSVSKIRDHFAEMNDRYKALMQSVSSQSDPDENPIIPDT
jgi:hypothetical protein